MTGTYRYRDAEDDAAPWSYLAATKGRVVNIPSQES